MAPVTIVKHLDIINDIKTSLFPCPVDRVENTLNFQSTEKALSYTIIPTIPFTTHTAQHTMSYELFLKGIAAILTASI